MFFGTEMWHPMSWPSWQSCVGVVDVNSDPPGSRRSLICILEDAGEVISNDFSGDQKILMWGGRDFDVTEGEGGQQRKSRFPSTRWHVILLCPVPPHAATFNEHACSVCMRVRGSKIFYDHSGGHIRTQGVLTEE